MKSKTLIRFILYPILAVAAIFLPIVIWYINSPVVAFTSPERNEQLFELFGFFSSLVLVSIACAEIKLQKARDLKRITFAALPLLVSILFLYLITEYPYPSGDYQVYELGAMAVIKHQNPYAITPRPYIYPPLFAQLMALLQVAINRLSHGLGANIQNEQSWYLLFYIYQSLQLFLVVITYYITLELANQMGLKRTAAFIVVSGLFLFNNPLIRTLKFNQINLWILISFSLGMIFIRRYPFFAGAAIALGGHLKLYPLIMILPWVILKRWWAIASVALVFSAIFLLQQYGGGWELWHLFLEYARNNLEKPTNFRNTALYGVTTNLFKVTQLPLVLVDKVVPFLTLVLFAWLLVRFLQREKNYFDFIKGSDLAPQKLYEKATSLRIYGHSIDTLAFSLLISPSVWEHHYVLAIPIALWAVATRAQDQPLKVFIGIFIIFCMPNFDIFLLSYHRLLGILILLYLTAPNSISFSAKKRLLEVSPVSEKGLGNES